MSCSTAENGLQVLGGLGFSNFRGFRPVRQSHQPQFSPLSKDCQASVAADLQAFCPVFAAERSRSVSLVSPHIVGSRSIVACVALFPPLNLHMDSGDRERSRAGSRDL